MGEARIWSELEHANVMALAGYVMFYKHPCLIAEWERNGTVIEYVKKNAGCDHVELVSYSS